MFKNEWESSFHASAEIAVIVTGLTGVCAEEISQSFRNDCQM